MDRLTSYKNDYKREMICRYEDCDTCEEYCPDLNEDNCPCLQEVLEKLAEYEDLDEQGRLLKLPCKVGDMVWDIDFGRPCSYEVTGFSFGSLNDNDWEEEKILDKVVVYYANSNGSITGTFAVSEIGKTVFLKKSAAEQALKEMEGKK